MKNVKGEHERSYLCKNITYICSQLSIFQGQLSPPSPFDFKRKIYKMPVQIHECPLPSAYVVVPYWLLYLYISEAFTSEAFNYILTTSDRERGPLLLFEYSKYFVKVWYNISIDFFY
jgi:hypothetical protein